AAMRQPVPLRPDPAASYRNRAAVLVAAGRAEEARELLKRAISAMPREAGLCLTLAAIGAQMGDTTGALEALQRAINAMPTAASSWREIGHAYAEFWKYEEADRALALASTLDPGNADTESLRAMMKKERV